MVVKSLKVLLRSNQLYNSLRKKIQRKNPPRNQRNLNLLTRRKLLRLRNSQRKKKVRKWFLKLRQKLRFHQNLNQRIRLLRKKILFKLVRRLSQNQPVQRNKINQNRFLNLQVLLNKWLVRRQLQKILLSQSCHPNQLSLLKQLQQLQLLLKLLHQLLPQDQDLKLRFPSQLKKFNNLKLQLKLKRKTSNPS